MPLGIPSASGSQTAQQRRDLFVGALLGILGDTRLLWLPKSTDTTTSTGEALTARTLTHNATLAGRLTAQGDGQMAAYSPASGHYSLIADAADLSFGNGATDSAFSVLALVNVTDTAAARTIIAKAETNDGSGNGAEWEFMITSADKLMLRLWDNSAGATPDRTSDAAITQGSPVLLGATYSGTGGASALNGATLYQNGQSVASTATNSGAYVAMEDKASEVSVGAEIGHAFNRFNGSIGMLALCAGALTAAQMWQIKKLVAGHFGVTL